MIRMARADWKYIPIPKSLNAKLNTLLIKKKGLFQTKAELVRHLLANGLEELKNE